MTKTLSRVAVLLGSLSLGLGGQACARQTPRAIAASPANENAKARRLLCGDVDEKVCLAHCPDSLDREAHVRCLLELRFRSDPEALSVARVLYLEMETPLGIEMHSSIEGYKGERVDLFPALPIGEQRHHLHWLHGALTDFGVFLERVGAHASKPVLFERRVDGVRFFRTSQPSFPSAYCTEGVISYNVDGLLHADPREMRETFFHELFHVNALRRSTWSVRTLNALYGEIQRRCAGDHACLEAFAPHPTMVPHGTYYAFDHRTGDVREYAAELALRYFLEHQRILDGEELDEAPFKCRSAENAYAWREMADAFFGGVDLTPECGT